MKKSYIAILVLLSCITMNAQTIEFSLMYVGMNETTNNYQVAFMATPSSPLNNVSMEDMGGGFYLPTGLSIGNFDQGNSGLPATEWTSQSMGSNSNGDGYFLYRVEAGNNSVSLNGAGPFQLVVFDIIADPNPTTGTISFVENDDPIFDSLFVQNYINLNLGSGPVDAYQQNDPLASSVDFSTLSLELQMAFEEFGIYPNPISSTIFIYGPIETLKKVEIFSTNGQQLLLIESDFYTIDFNAYTSGVYFIRFHDGNGIKTMKIIKQ